VFNVVRPQPAPVSLGAQRSYTDADVITALRTAFFDKCYLCESKNPSALNVEHFDPHLGNAAKKYDWNNLFYVCARCNNIKRDGFTNLLDCTDATVDVFRRLRLLPPNTPYQKEVVVMPMIVDVKTQETARLLNEIYNSNNTANKRVTASYLRSEVFRQYNYFMESVNAYFDKKADDADRAKALKEMKVMMKSDQEFSAFLRWIVIEDEMLEPLLSSSIG
jgi:hypothetical protein